MNIFDMLIRILIVAFTIFFTYEYINSRYDHRESNKNFFIFHYIFGFSFSVIAVNLLLIFLVRTFNVIMDDPMAWWYSVSILPLGVQLVFYSVLLIEILGRLLKMRFAKSFLTLRLVVYFVGIGSFFL